MAAERLVRRWRRLSVVGVLAAAALLIAALAAAAPSGWCAEFERGEWRLIGCIEDDDTASWTALGEDGSFWIWLGEGWQRQSAEAAEALAYLNSIEPAPETWDDPHPRYERRHWESFDLERYDESVYESAFYAPPGIGGRQERDHFVALAEAHQSGGAYWEPQRKAEFALDAANIFWLPAAANREKWAYDPADWRPARRDVWQRYAVHWIQIKRKWSLSFDTGEIAALRQLIRAPPN